jgi:hypothetical protein
MADIDQRNNDPSVALEPKGTSSRNSENPMPKRETSDSGTDPKNWEANSPQSPAHDSSEPKASQKTEVERSQIETTPGVDSIINR